MGLALPGGAAAAAPTFTVTEGGSGVAGLATADDLAGVLLGPGVSLEGAATVNGSVDPADYGARLPSFGRFAAGADDLGIADGLMITANARAASFATESVIRSPEPSATDDDLFAVVDGAGLCLVGTAEDCVYNATSLEFAVRPTAPFLKFEYALAVTENGTWFGPNWSGYVYGYPDGLALLVNGRAVENNCAVVPGTSTYLTMETAGVVPPLADRMNADQARANLAARVLDSAAPNGFAYSTGLWDPRVPGVPGNSAWAVRFLTVPLTCVADVSAAHQAGTPTTVKIVVGDVNDGAASPAVFLKGGAVRFSENATPSDAPDPTPEPEPQPEPVPAPEPSPVPAPGPAPDPTPVAAPPAAVAPGPATVTPLAPAGTRALPGGRSRVVQRLQLDQVGRYTFTYINRRTGERIVQLPGGRIGARVLGRPASAPVLVNRRAGKRLVVVSRFARAGLPAHGDIVLRIVLKRPDGSLHAVSLGADGRVG